VRTETETAFEPSLAPLKFPTIWRDFQEHRNKTAIYGVGVKKLGYRFGA
jgi:hypothetical protein